jgi:hypothetical protein
MKTLIIYFTDSKKHYQIIKPLYKPEGGWYELAHAITGGNFHSIEVI